MTKRHGTRVARSGVLGTVLLLAATLGAACSSSPGATEQRVCGNGVVETGERCDGADVGGETCESLGFGAGTLVCAASCADFDRSRCGAPTTCGNGRIDAPDLFLGGLGLKRKGGVRRR